MEPYWRSRVGVREPIRIGVSGGKSLGEVKWVDRRW